MTTPDPHPDTEPPEPCAYCLDLYDLEVPAAPVECCEHGTTYLCPTHEQRAYARFTCMSHGD